MSLIKLHNAILNEAEPEKKRFLVQEERALKESKRKIESVLNSISLSNTNNWVAARMGQNMGTVATHLSRAKVKLKKRGMTE